MRQGPLSLLLALSLLAPALHAQEEPASPAPSTEQAAADAEEYAAPAAQPAADSEAVQGLLLRLREENQRLRLQLQAEQAKATPMLLTEQQQWFAVGGGVGVVSFILGLLVTRSRRRRQWIN